jgi:hypothetical protein
MVVRAVAFDIGGVLERVAPREHWLGPWRDRLGMSEPEFESAVSRVDPDDRIEVGSLSEAEYSQRFAAALGLSGAALRPGRADAPGRAPPGGSGALLGKMARVDQREAPCRRDE